MIIPDIEEVRDYFFLKLQDMDLATSESEKYYDYWMSRSWTYGKTKITKWKFSVNTWIRNIKAFKPKQQSDGKSFDDIDKLFR